MATRCERKGHRWRQRIVGALGEDVCRRWGCPAMRINPMALPPEMS